MMSSENSNEMWKKSRSGAWAGRGFHYQHLVISHLLVEQWAGLRSPSIVVPEGLEDCVLEGKEHSIWLQIKSKSSGTIGKTQLNNYLHKVQIKASELAHFENIKSAIITETDEKSIGSEELKDLGRSKGSFFHCQDPEFASESVIKSRLQVAEIVAESILSDIYKCVAQTSAENASLTYESRKKLSVGDIEKVVTKTLEFSDLERIDFALQTKIVVPLDLSPLTDASFYKGVKARLGHVSAGLIFDDEERLIKYQEALCSNKIVLISGPSGAGKSSAMWSCVYRLTSQFRWFELAPRATIDDVEAILSFIQSRKPSSKSPIAIAMDEINSENIQVWNYLAIEVKKRHHLLLLGSVRSEDSYLVESKSNICIFSHGLTEGVAQKVWKQLNRRGQTSWEYWREPFDVSKGLLLEYVHVLTQGQRLSDVIKEQVETREKEERYDELAVLRISSAASALGGEIDTDNLLKVTGLSRETLSKSLKRLLNEHLVFEIRPGVLGGLHQLRSLELFEASHDQLVFKSDDSIWKSLQALTHDSIATFVLRMLVDHQEQDKSQILRKLALALEDNKTPKFWEGILNGLGFYSCELIASDLIEVLQKHQVRKSVWLAVSMFAIAGIQPPELSKSVHWEVVLQALEEFKSLEHVDYRKYCLESLPTKGVLPHLEGAVEAIDFLSSLCPIGNVEPASISVHIQKPEGDIFSEDIIKLLSVMYAISPESARDLAVSLEGENKLIESYGLWNPWLSNPVIETNGKYGKTVCADYYVVDEDTQGDIHEQVVIHCKKLLALCPSAAAVAVKATFPNGVLYEVGGYPIAEKNIPRTSLPTDVNVSWNIIFHKLINNKAYDETNTCKAKELTQIIRKVEYLLSEYSEYWIGAKPKLNKEKFAQRVNKLISEVNEIQVAPFQALPRHMSGQAESVPVDRLSGALSGILTTLMNKMGVINLKSNLKADAMYSSDLVNDLVGLVDSEIWKYIEDPPFSELTSIAKKVRDISSIFHEFSEQQSESNLAEVLLMARKAKKGKAILEAARYCKKKAKSRLIERLTRIKNELNITAHFYVRPTDKKNTHIWPSLDVAFLIEVKDLLTGIESLEQSLSVLRCLSEEGIQISVAMICNGAVLSQLAVKPALSLPLSLPDLTFEQDWQNIIETPFFVSRYNNHFTVCQSSIDSLSRLIECVDLEALHKEEYQLYKHLESEFLTNADALTGVCFDADDGQKVELKDLLDEQWKDLSDELEQRKLGADIESPLYSQNAKLLEGQVQGKAASWVVARILLLNMEVLRYG
ncbi:MULTISPECIES: hypothetical protein [unclassified Alteromonas]|uniref:hypothetical protein n=1 Tax=unclassified Alteromonas TaxID=2614992 RepID=UPI001EF176DF|nr:MULTISPECIES: hypothetical protein [unclassified Alteromonas]MCG7635817.1 hypothetical protein [Alteromonas sp. CNT1-28]MCG7811464.1 hypothetical protein [Alteromonas sp. MCA-1]